MLPEFACEYTNELEQTFHDNIVCMINDPAARVSVGLHTRLVSSEPFGKIELVERSESSLLRSAQPPVQTTTPQATDHC